MKEININNIVLVIAIISLGSFSLRQCSDKKTWKKAYEEKVEECNTSVVEKESFLKTEKLLKDSISYYISTTESALKKKDAKYAYLKAHTKVLSDSIGKLSIQESKGFIDANFAPKGDSVSITSNQVKEIHVSELECRDLRSYSSFQEEVIRELDKAYGNCSKINTETMKKLSSCEDSNREKDIKIKSLRRKVMGRTVLGISGVVLAVLAVI